MSGERTVAVLLPRPSEVPSINATAGWHWGKTKQVKDEWVQAGHVAGVQMKTRLRSKAQPTTMERALVKIHIDMVGERRRDPHNYMSTACKWFVDGLVYSGLLVDDSQEHLDLRQPIFQTIARGTRPTITVFVTRLT